MKILWLGRCDDYSMGARLYFLRKSLEKFAEIITCGWGFPNQERDVVKLVKQFEPDVIFLRGGPDFNYNIRNDRWKNLNKVKVPKALNYSDPQTVPLRLEWINHYNIEMTLHPYKKIWIKKRVQDFREFAKFVPSSHKIRWLPMAVPDDIFKNYGQERIYDVALLGRVYWLYPLRMKMWRTLLERKDVSDPSYNDTPHMFGDVSVFHRVRPRQTWGWTKKQQNRNPKTILKETYVETLNRCKTMMFDGSLHRFAVTKYFEGLATGTLVLADAPLDASELHFIPNVNFVEVNKENFLVSLRHYLNNPDERKWIAKNGRSVILKYHTTDIRAKQLVNYLEELL